MKTNIIWGTALELVLLLFIFRFYTVDKDRRAWLLDTRHVEAICTKNTPTILNPKGPRIVGRIRLLAWEFEGSSCYVRDLALPEGPDGRWQITVARAPNGLESAPAKLTIERGVVQ